MSWVTSAWRNPFPVAPGQEKVGSQNTFRAWGERQPWLVDSAKSELRGKHLDSQSPETWHGEVLEAWVHDTLPRWVLVFGSNLSGRHGNGPARHALEFHGAKMGVGQGIQGNSWAFPTKDAVLKTLPLSRIEEEAHHLIHYAKFAPNYHFQVTRVGCGLAGYTDEQVAPFFINAPENIHLPGRWQSILHPSALSRVVVCGSRSITEPELVHAMLSRLQDRIGDFEVVSGGAEGPDRLGEDFAVVHNLPFVRFPAKWCAFGKSAGYLRNTNMIAWYGTHVTALWDGVSPGTRHAIATAKQEGLPVWVPRL